MLLYDNFAKEKMRLSRGQSTDSSLPSERSADSLVVALAPHDKLYLYHI